MINVKNMVCELRDGKDLVIKPKPSEEEEQEKRSTNQILKSALEVLSDPASNMTEEEKQLYLKKVSAKLKSGKKLSQKEMSFLRTYDPEMYRRAKRIEYRRKSLENKLEHCRSKQEAQEVFSEAIDQVSDKDPDREYLVRAYQDVFDQFKTTSNYKRLPNQEEEREDKRASTDLEWVLVDDQVSPIYELIDEMPVLDVIS